MFKKRIAVYLFGFNFVVLGIALLISSSMGQSAWDGVNVGLSKILPINVGQATIISAITLLTISYVLSRQWKVYLSFITSLIQGLLVQMYLGLISNTLGLDNMMTRIILFITGILCMAIGCAIYIQSDFPTNHVDKLMLSIAGKFNLSLRNAKWITDSAAIFLTFILVGKVEYGTFLIIVTLGPLMSFFEARLRIPIRQYIGLR